MKRKVLLWMAFFVALFVVMMVLPGCASSRKDTYMQKKYKADAQSHVNTTMLGRNKYFYSTKYQKKLSRFKKK